MDSKIIVLCPTKNEEWIIRAFLEITGLFADLIIVADQFSTDATAEICKQYSNVVLVKNTNPDYDEAHRQNLLIAESRKHFVDCKKILIAIDADEVIAANGIKSTEWELIKNLPLGTVIKFKKPEVIFHEQKCLLGSGTFPIGYVDDGAEHHGRKIHSTRIPYRATSPVYESSDIVFMHLALSRIKEYKARQNLYSITEKLKKTKNIVQRLSYYSPALNFLVTNKNFTALPEQWCLRDVNRNYDFSFIKTTDYNPYNFQIVDIILSHGKRKFLFDDIWAISYIDVWKNHPNHSPHTNLQQLASPPFWAKAITKVLVLYTRTFYQFKGRLRSLLLNK